ncbi:MAG: ABC transporter ATP-binding protein, partial [Pseudomonadota bacterium]
AMGLLCQPDILIADEPTTALDVTVQSQIIRLLDELAEQSSTAILLITHDLGIIAGLSDHVLVMRHGEIVERADVDPLFESPAHPYTELLLKSVPRLDQPLAGTEPSKPDSTPRQARAPVLTIEQLSVQYQVSTGNGWLKPHFDTIRAVDDISFELQPAETLGIVGESGCGKSTLARAILGLVRPASGQIVWMGKNLVELDEDSMRRQRRDIQMVFQDPLGSLDPRMTVGQIIGEPLRNFFPSMSRLQVRERALGMLQMVGLRPEHINRYPHEFSGGQCQRIGIARALVANPRLVVCDEPVSALDVSIQAQIIKLLQDLQQKLRLSLIFIAHDLSVVRHMSDRVLVMHEGKIVELADSDRIYTDPQHPYTQQLIESVPIPDPAAERERSRRLAERLDQVVE